MLAYRQFLLLLLVALAACAGTPAQTETPLFTANARAEGSQNVDVIVEEVARYQGTSVVDVHFNYGPSVASSVFSACSFAKLARLRGYRYTVDVRDYGKPGRYLVGFIPAPSQEAISALGPEFEKHDPSQVTDSAMFDRICPKS